jgi:hypothetical protein
VTQRAALLALHGDSDLAQLRSDFAANIAEVWRILVRYASWRDRTTRPTRARVCAQAGIGESTWKRCRRWLQGHGWLGLVRAGTTAWLHGAAVLNDQDAGNEAAVYVLSIPHAKRRITPAALVTPVTGPPSGSRSEPDLSPARAREPKPGRGAASGRAVPPSVVAAVRKGPGQRISEAYGAHLARPFARAGWTGTDVAYAVDHEPGGAQHRFDVARVASPGAWLRWRLSRWLDPAGQPLPAPSAERAAAAQQLRAEQAERRARRHQAAAAAAGVDAGTRAAAIRAAMGWASAPRGQEPSG